MAESDAEALIPLYGFLQGDTLGLLVLATARDTIADVAAKLQQVARVRVAPRTVLSVEHAGRALPLDRTVAGAGIAAFDRIDVRTGGQP